MTKNRARVLVSGRRNLTKQKRPEKGSKPRKRGPRAAGMNENCQKVKGITTATWHLEQLKTVEKRKRHQQVGVTDKTGLGESFAGGSPGEEREQGKKEKKHWVHHSESKGKGDSAQNPVDAGV